MPQPDYVPLRPADRVRPTERLPAPDAWRPDRPADIETPRQPEGPRLGSAGPDQGYGVKLAKQFDDRLVLGAGEHIDDAIAGCLAVALKRAAVFGRAPVIYDFEFAYTLWGFLGGAPDDLVETRRGLFEVASHHYEAQRAIADAVPEPTLRLSPSEVSERLRAWKHLLKLQK